MLGMDGMWVDTAVIVTVRRERGTRLISLPKAVRDAAQIPDVRYLCLRVLRPGVIQLTPVEITRAPIEPTPDHH